VAILGNPVAGTRSSRPVVEALAHALRGRGVVPEICWRREELTAMVGAGGQALDCVVAAGGDGTLGEVLNRAPGMPVAILPLGNENLMARHFGLGSSVEALADAIATSPVQRLDLGRVRGRVFSLMAGAGFDAEVVHWVHRERRGNINKLHYAVGVARALQHYAFPGIEVEIVDTGEKLQGAMVFVFNMPRYGLGLPIADRARPDDGLLDLWVFGRPGVRNLLRYIWDVFGRRHKGRRSVRHRLVRRVRLSSEKPVPLQTDGDPAGSLPVMVEVMAGALGLIAPFRVGQSGTV
jgi:diacylglycerol kinase family enzyme